MSKKVYYSKPLNFFWRNYYAPYKHNFPNLSNELIFQNLRNNILNLPTNAFESEESRSLIISGLEMWRDDLRGDLLHVYFLDKNLKTFLEETNLSDLNGIKEYLKINGNEVSVNHLHNDTISQAIVYKYSLHLPFDKNGYAFRLSIEEDGSLELYYSLGEFGGRMSNKFYADVCKKTDDISQLHAKIYRLGINILAYINCFPECVKEGVPQNIFSKSYDINSENITIGISEKIKSCEGSGLSKIPHFRKGYFRHLNSDYFVNKKGALIYISETMVKGKAITVDSIKVDKLEK